MRPVTLAVGPCGDNMDASVPIKGNRVRQHSIILLLYASLASAAPGASADDAMPMPPAAAHADRLVKQLLQATGQLRDYQTVLTKQQRIRGELRATETIRLKHRLAPECRYLLWLEGPNEDREVLHCPNRDEGKMKVHEGGFLGLITIWLDPFGKRARRDDLHPITETGIYTIAALVRDDHAYHEKTRDARVELSQRAVHEQPSTCISSPTGTSLSTLYVAGRREVCVHDQLNLPTEVHIWSEAGELMEHYTFRDYQPNPGFTDADFDPDNPDYRF